MELQFRSRDYIAKIKCVRRCCLHGSIVQTLLSPTGGKSCWALFTVVAKANFCLQGGRVQFGPYYFSLLCNPGSSGKVIRGCAGCGRIISPFFVPLFFTNILCLVLFLSASKELVVTFVRSQRSKLVVEQFSCTGFMLGSEVQFVLVG